jgi:hypothetical protein
VLSFCVYFSGFSSVRNLFFRYFPSPDFGGRGRGGVDFFITCTENEIQGMSCFSILPFPHLGEGVRG